MPTHDDAAPQLPDGLLEELNEHARVLSAYDQAQDVALDLHEKPFSPETRSRALQYLQSPEYQRAIDSVRPHAGEGA